MIKKRNEPKNLARLLKRPRVIVDKTPTSSDYFNITFLPTELVAGKNVIKIQGTQNLVKASEVQFEIFDSNGTPIFYEVLNYLAADGSRVIVLYIYPDTAAGRATLYLAGRALVNAETGEQLPLSEDPNSEFYVKEPNVLWTNNIIVNPLKENTGEIIYLAPPKVTIKELIQTFKVPDTTVVPLKVAESGSGNNTISSNPTNLVPPTTTGLASSVGYTPPTTLNIVKEGQFRPTKAGASVDSAPAITLAADTVLNTARTVGTSGNILRLDNKNLLPRVYTKTSFFKKDMQGGSLTITVDTSSLLPRGSNIIPLGQSVGGNYVLSNVYNATIVEVINDTTAVVSQPFTYYYRNTTGTKTVVGTNKATIQSVTGFGNATSFTASFIQRITAVTDTESSQSYADIYISNLEPAAGDVYKVQTFYKPYGALGNFTDAGFTVVENTSIMNDSSSLVSDVLLGQKEQPKGDFTSQNVINTYWQLTNVNIAGAVLPAITSSGDRLIDGMTITTGSGITLKDVDANNINASATYVTLKDKLDVAANTEYKLVFKTVGVDSATYKTTQYPNATIDVYISGSVGIDAVVDETVTDKRLNARSKKFLGNKNLGTYLGSFTSAGAYLENAYTFRPLADGAVNPLFVVRSGQWTLSDVDIIAEKQSGFTPNYTNFKVRIPSVYINTEMIFNFKYFDSANNPAPVESTVVGIIFKGNNFYIAGTNNLLTGSVYIGNAIGSGIEMAGVSSGFIRSIGYEGYTSASLGYAPGGFLMWSGSNKLEIGADNYQGVGLELVGANDNSHLIFSTSGSGKLDIKAEAFFIGSQNTQYISGSNGQIEISSSLFWLDPATNTLIIGASASILAPVAADQIFTPAIINGSQSNVTNASSSITSQGFAKFVSASIGGFDINTSQIKGGNLILDKQGIVQTADYVKDVRGFKITAEEGGVAEFENIKIRGTLKTTVFEKESVNAVGGQLYVANSTTISGSVSPSASFFLVKNVTGFENGEIITAKKFSAASGAGTEYLRIYSSSRNNPLSETDLSGLLYVTRSYGSGSSGTSGSIGDYANVSQSYEEGQVIVSTGKVGTGFIRINANPNDTATPYIDIVERTGSGVYDVRLKARLGDLSGLAGTAYVFNTGSPGFGLATENVFLQGGIVANFGNIGGFNISRNAITGSGFYLSGSATGNQFFISSSKFNVKANGDMSGSNVLITGDINANTGYFKDINIIGTLYNTRTGPDVTAYTNANTNRIIETWVAPKDTVTKTILSQSLAFGSSSFTSSVNTRTDAILSTDVLSYGLVSNLGQYEITGSNGIDYNVFYFSSASFESINSALPNYDYQSLITSSLIYPLLSHGYVTSSDNIVTGSRILTGELPSSGSYKKARIAGIKYDGTNYYVTSSIPIDANITGSIPATNIFFTVRVTGSMEANIIGSINGKNLNFGRLGWKLTGPIWTGSVTGSGDDNPAIEYYKDYTSFPDYRSATTFLRWNEDVNSFEEYQFSSSFNLNSNTITPFSGFIFLSSSYAIVSQSVYSVFTSPTIERVVNYTRPMGAGNVNFTGTISTNQYGTVMIINDSYAYTTSSYNNANSSASPDSIESDWVDISSLKNTDGTLDGLKLQFAMRWVDNMSDNIDITSYFFNQPYSYRTYGGHNQLGLYAYVYLYGENLDTGVPTILAQRAITQNDGTYSQNTYTWYVFDEFVDSLLRYTNDTAPDRIKIKIQWYAHTPDIGGVGFEGITYAYALGRFNGIALSELRLVKAAEAKALSVTDLKIRDTSISTNTAGHSLILNANAILPKPGKTGGDTTTTIGTETNAFASVYANGMYPGTDAAYNLGSSTLRWNTLYAVNNVINTSDRNQKTNIQLSDLGLAFINQLTPVSYNWISNRDKTLHYGLIAQDLKQVLDNNNKDNMYMAFDGTSIAYVELIAPMIRAIQELTEKVTRLETQISSSKQ